MVELSPRDSISEEESKALALSGTAPYAWPLRSAHPQHLQVAGWVVGGWVGGHYEGHMVGGMMA